MTSPLDLAPADGSVLRLASNAVPERFRGALLLAVANPARAVAAARAAAWVAAAQRLPVVVLTVLPLAEAGPETAAAPPLALSLALDALSDSGLHLAWRVVEDPDPGAAVGKVARDLRASMIVMGWPARRSPDQPLGPSLSAVLTDPRTDVVVVGGHPGRELGCRILVPWGRGAHSALAFRLAKDLGPGHTIVTILCDYGTRYQSKLFNPEFLKAKGLPVPEWLDRAPQDLPSVFEG